MRKVISSFHLLLFASASVASAASNLPALDEAVLSKSDIYADAALTQPNGPSYEFFRALIRPLHYVNTDFQHYPIILSAPTAKHKSRLIANGSAINARANTKVWNDSATPVLFRVGNDQLAFGQYLQRLDGPKFAEGWLPIVQFTYHHGAGKYSQETFASVQPSLASNAVSFSRFSYTPNGNGDTNELPGRVAVKFETDEPLKAENGRVLNAKGEVLAWYDSSWKWMPAQHLLDAILKDGSQAVVAVSGVPSPASTPSPFESGGYDEQHSQCAAEWQKILADCMNIQTPEPYVNDAWRSLIVANFGLINVDSIHYSALNQYDRIYNQEGSQAALAMMQYGYEDEMRHLLVPLLDFTRKGLEFHQAGHKLDDICRYYWQTRDADYVNKLRPRWQKEVDRLANHRSSSNGLFPREQYCGDIPTMVFSMTSNTEGWRAMHDTAALLDELGDRSEAARLRKVSGEFHDAIMAAVDKSARKDGDALFVPNALLGEEQPYAIITENRAGNYWNLMANNILGTEFFGPNSEQETGMCRYFQEHGGLFMGLDRACPWPAFWVHTNNLNPLYGWYYARTLLRRDEPDRALVSFYGMLAAGFTQDTFVCGEGCSIEPVDEWGRQFYCPPNSAGNAYFLLMLRHLLVQDWDLNEDGVPETLRLLFATPKRWLEDGKIIKVERAPTAFGPVSINAKSKLSEGKVIAEIDLPQRNQPKQALIRIRVPDGWRVNSARAGDTELKLDAQGTADISTLRGKVTLEFQVSKN